MRIVYQSAPGDTMTTFGRVRIGLAQVRHISGQPIPGARLAGWGPVLADILKLDFGVVVRGTGPQATRCTRPKCRS